MPAPSANLWLQAMQVWLNGASPRPAGRASSG